MTREPKSDELEMISRQKQDNRHFESVGVNGLEVCYVSENTINEPKGKGEQLTIRMNEIEI